MGQRFPVILMDPPWSFRVYNKDSGHGRSAESHYGTMSPGELESLDLLSVAEKDCALLIWSTFPTLPQAIELGNRLGFEYKTCAFLWAKLNKKSRSYNPEDDANWHMGMGFITRANAEPCLLFTRGNPKRKSKGVRQLIVSPIGEHSEKPEEIHRRIVKLYDPPYLELFARRQYQDPRWTCVGNEITGNDIRTDLAILSGRNVLHLF